MRNTESLTKRDWQLIEQALEEYATRLDSEAERLSAHKRPKMHNIDLHRIIASESREALAKVKAAK